MTNINIETIIDNAQQNLTQTFSDIINKQTVATCYDMFLNHDKNTSIQLSPVMRNLLQTKSFVITPAYAEWVGLNKFSNFCQFEMTPEFLIRVDEDDLNKLQQPMLMICIQNYLQSSFNVRTNKLHRF